MASFRWLRIVSWHAVRHGLRDGGWKTYCGRFADADTVDDLPGGERTCESCLRIVARLVDTG